MGERASLIVLDPAGGRNRVPVHIFPFLIGRQQGNHLVLRDARISREHARIVAQDEAFFIEDLGSRNGVFVNDERIERRRLSPSDRIEFGVPDSYRLIFSQDQTGDNLGRLRAVVEMARVVETSYSTSDVLAALVDAALAITGAERGFLLLRTGSELEFRVARSSRGEALGESDLRVPRSLIQQALARRRELLSMNFDPNAADPLLATQTVVDLDLRSVVCVPLVRIRAGMEAETAQETIGVLYLDSRAGAADLSSGNQELLQTLALEASTILENARLIEGERARQKFEEELNIARGIQASLLPRQLPSAGWLQAAGRSSPSRQVGGDYFDIHQINPSTWALVNADVSGKGVSAALLASLLQGVFLAAPYTRLPVEQAMAGVNAFLLERTEGEKYATVFSGTLNRDGLLRYVNAGHGDPLLVRSDGRLERLHPTGLPVGMLEEATYSAAEVVLLPGDKLVLFTDGLTEAENSEGQPFGEARVRELLRAHPAGSCQALCDTLEAAVTAFADGAVQKDDRTIMVVGYFPERD